MEVGDRVIVTGDPDSGYTLSATVGLNTEVLRLLSCGRVAEIIEVFHNPFFKNSDEDYVALMIDNIPHLMRQKFVTKVLTENEVNLIKQMRL